jgi:hypothetical protein
LYFAANIIWGIKSREIRWAGHVACMEERCLQGFGRESCGKRPFGRSGRDGRIILDWILKKSVGGAWIDPFWFRIGTLWVLVGVIMSLRAPYNVESFLPS